MVNQSKRQYRHQQAGVRAGDRSEEVRWVSSYHASRLVGLKAVDQDGKPLLVRYDDRKGEYVVHPEGDVISATAWFGQQLAKKITPKQVQRIAKAYQSYAEFRDFVGRADLSDYAPELSWRYPKVRFTLRLLRRHVTPTYWSRAGELMRTHDIPPVTVLKELIDVGRGKYASVREFEDGLVAQNLLETGAEPGEGPGRAYLRMFVMGKANRILSFDDIPGWLTAEWEYVLGKSKAWLRGDLEGDLRSW